MSESQYHDFVAEGTSYLFQGNKGYLEPSISLTLMPYQLLLLLLQSGDSIFDRNGTKRGAVAVLNNLGIAVRSPDTPTPARLFDSGDRGITNLTERSASAARQIDGANSRTHQRVLLASTLVASIWINYVNCRFVAHDCFPFCL